MWVGLVSCKCTGCCNVPSKSVRVLFDEMGLRRTPRFACQSSTAALLSLLGCGIGLAQIGLGTYLWIFSGGFVFVLGEPMRNAFIGYMTIGVLQFLSCLFGVIAALIRNNYGLLLFVVFSLASIASQCGVWVFIYLEQVAIAQELSQRIQSMTEYYDFLGREFNCYLQTGSLLQQALESCANFVAGRMWIIVWSMLGLLIALIWLQFVLIIMASMLFSLITEELTKNKVQIAPVEPPQTILSHAPEPSAPPFYTLTNVPSNPSSLSSGSKSRTTKIKVQPASGSNHKMASAGVSPNRNSVSTLPKSGYQSKFELKKKPKSTKIEV